MHAAEFPALGTGVRVVVVEGSALGPARDAVARALDAIDRACSRFRPDSELMRLNGAAGAPQRVSATLVRALAAALGAARLTAGLVDPTVGRAVRLAGYDTTFAHVRRRDGSTVRARVAAAPGPGALELDERGGIARVAPGAELDLGATAKALAADDAARAAHRAAGGPVLVSLGGDVAVVGGAPADGWPVRLCDDHRDLDGPGPVVAIAGGGLATSSVTVRRWETADGPRHHLIDPRTGRSTETAWRTVSVAAGSCLEANVASTAALVMGGSAPAWLAGRGLPARLVRRDGAVVRVAGWPQEDPA